MSHITISSQQKKVGEDCVKLLYNIFLDIYLYELIWLTLLPYAIKFYEATEMLLVPSIRIISINKYPALMLRSNYPTTQNTAFILKRWILKKILPFDFCFWSSLGSSFDFLALLFWSSFLPCETFPLGPVWVKGLKYTTIVPINKQSTTMTRPIFHLEDVSCFLWICFFEDFLAGCLISAPPMWPLFAAFLGASFVIFKEEFGLSFWTTIGPL